MRAVSDRDKAVGLHFSGCVYALDACEHKGGGFAFPFACVCVCVVARVRVWICAGKAVRHQAIGERARDWWPSICSHAFSHPPHEPLGPRVQPAEHPPQLPPLVQEVQPAGQVGAACVAGDEGCARGHWIESRQSCVCVCGAPDTRTLASARTEAQTNKSNEWGLQRAQRAMSCAATHHKSRWAAG